MRTTYIVCGSPGGGKSTYARGLASARRAALLDIDTVTERPARIALREAGLGQDGRLVVGIQPRQGRPGRA